MNFNKVTLINFTQLTDENKTMILKWRNYDVIRKWMYNTDLISLGDHFKFIKNLEKDSTKKFFLVTNYSECFGVINFTDIDYNKGEANFGLYANPNVRNVGKVLMKIICDYGFDKLKMKRILGEVFNDNFKAINLYKKFNFVEYKCKLVNNKEVICMELKNENQ